VGPRRGEDGCSEVVSSLLGQGGSDVAVGVKREVEFLTEVKAFIEVCCEHVFESVTGQFLVGDRL